MKSSNLITLLALLLPLSGCAGRPDYTLNPSASTEWVTVTVRLPPQTEVTPMDVLYRSEKCQREVYDPTIESHRSMERGKNPQVLSLMQQNNSAIWQSRIALDGGGKCEWQLSTIRVDIQPVSTLSLAEGKNIIPTSYVFGFDEEAYAGGGGVGRKKEAYGDLHLRTELFPTVFVNNLLNKKTLKLFGGNTNKKKWSRHYRLHNVKNIIIDPDIHFKKVVTLESPKSPSAPPGMTITYPDGSVEHKRGIIPDYEKLLSIK